MASASSASTLEPRASAGTALIEFSPVPDRPGGDIDGAAAPADGDACLSAAQRSAALAVRAVDEAFGGEAVAARRVAPTRVPRSHFVSDASLDAGWSAEVARAASTVPAIAGRLRRARRWLNRPHRVVLLLLAVWILSAFDLGFTLNQARSLDFHELNPVAARLLNQPPHVLFVYKFALLGASTVIFVWLRRHAIAELGCWLLMATLFYVSVRWFVYYEQLLAGPHDWIVAQ